MTNESTSPNPAPALDGALSQPPDGAEASGAASLADAAAAPGLTATDAAPAAGEPAFAPVPPEELKWYAIHVYSGFEHKVMKSIEYRLSMDEDDNGRPLNDFVERMIIPTHNVIEIKDGEKKLSERNLMPGYILAHMAPKDDVFEMVTSLAGVAGFVGDGKKPIAMSDAEIDHLLAQTTHRQEKPKTEILFSKNEQVKIIEGPFAGFNGSVSEIDAQRGKLSVMVSIFGRQTAVELDVLQVDRL